MAAGIAAWQLARIVSSAQSISLKAQNISQSGRGINIATDSVIQLSRTNRTAKSILKSAEPLQPRLDRIVGEARGIDGLAGSIDTSAGEIDRTADTINGSAQQINTTAGAINATAGAINLSAGAINSTAGAILAEAGDINSTAGAINTTAGQIQGTARGINSDAGGILREARQIDRDVFLINFYLNGSIDLAGQIRSDTRNIARLGVNAHDSASCIDRRVGGDAADRDCVGRDPGSGARTGPDGSAQLGRRGGPGPMGGG
ncbi:MAG: hypothetical protein LC790_07420 [Actinobacteria bacterium]|nr:hypothetical protein [Actinomycetota bacterium]